MSDFMRSIPITPDMVSLWVPSGSNRAQDLIRGNHGQCFGTHPNVPVITSDSGLGSLNYDNLSGTFVVGEHIIGGTSGAQGRVSSDDGSTLGLVGCHGRFHDNEQITGRTSGATANVNHPKTGAGVDLVRNGEFSEIDDDPPSGWDIAHFALLTTEAGGRVGNCLKVLENGGGGPDGRQTVSVTAGKVYRLTFWHKDVDSTGDDPKWWIYDVTHAAYIIPETTETAAANWTEVNCTFTVPAACTSVGLRFHHNAVNGDGDAYYFDEISLYKIDRYNLINTAVGWVFGGDDYVDCGNDASLRPESAATFGIWFKMSPGSAAWANIGGCWRYINAVNSTGFGIFRTASTETITFSMGFDGQNDAGEGNIPITYDTWHRAILTYDKSEGYLRFYLDGVPVGTPDTRTSNILYNVAHHLVLGANPTFTQYLKGSSALSFLTNEGWSPAQVANDYLNTKSFFAPRG